MTVDNYIYNLEGEQKDLMQALRNEILMLIPGVEERIAYGIPCFYYFGPLAYLAPKKIGVDLGFINGQKLVQAYPFLNIEKRKQVGSLFYKTLSDISSNVLRITLIEAADYNKEKKQVVKK